MLTTPPFRCLDIVRGLSSISSGERQIWAPIPGWWCTDGSLFGDEGGPISAVLAWSAAVETEVLEIREGLLFSLDSLLVLDLVPVSVLQQLVSDLPREKVHAAELDAYESLVAALTKESAVSPQRGLGSPVLAARTCLKLVRGLSSLSSHERQLTARATRSLATDGSLVAPQADWIAAILGWAIMVETQGDVRIAEVCALVTLANLRLVPLWTLVEVKNLMATQRLEGIEAEYYASLVAALSEATDL